MRRIIFLTVLMVSMVLPGEVNGRQSIEEMSQFLLSQSESGEVGSLSAGELNSLEEVAERRKELMLELAEEDPQAFLDHAMSGSEYDQLPLYLREEGLVEKPVEMSGRVREIVVDNFEEGRAESEYVFQTEKGEVYTLSMPGGRELAASTIQIITGYEIEDALVVRKSVLEEKSNEGVPEYTMGQQKLAVILVQFEDDKRVKFDKEQWGEAVFKDDYSVKEYYLENSFGNLEFEGEVFGPVEIPYTFADCKYKEWAVAASDALARQGADISSYRFQVLTFPKHRENYEFCHPTASAWGTMGADPYGISWVPIFIDSPIPPETIERGHVAHEIGHSLGLGHAGKYECDDLRPVGGPDWMMQGCDWIEYGDDTDVMGSRDYGHFGGIGKSYLGWLEKNQTKWIQEDGEYEISPIEYQDGIKQLRIPTNTSFVYNISYRKPVGFDAELPDYFRYGGDIHEGVYLHLTNLSFEDRDYFRSNTIYASSDSWKTYLPLGQTFHDDFNNLQISIESIDAGIAKVKIDLDPDSCKRGGTNIRVNTDVVEANSNDIVEYSITIGNTDSVSCGESVYAHSVYGNGNTHFKRIVPDQVVLDAGESKTIRAKYQVLPKKEEEEVLVDVLFYPKEDGNMMLHRRKVDLRFRYVDLNYKLKTSLEKVVGWVGDGDIELIAALIDGEGGGIVEGVNYFWELLTSRDLVSLVVDGNAVILEPLNSGEGELSVKARVDQEMLSKVIPILIYPATDIDRDFSVDWIDLDKFFDYLIVGDLDADINGSGEVDGLDYSWFVNDFGVGVELE